MARPPSACGSTSVRSYRASVQRAVPPRRARGRAGWRAACRPAPRRGWSGRAGRAARRTRRWWARRRSARRGGRSGRRRGRPSARPRRASTARACSGRAPAIVGWRCLPPQCLAGLAPAAGATSSRAAAAQAMTDRVRMGDLLRRRTSPGTYAGPAPAWISVRCRPAAQPPAGREPAPEVPDQVVRVLEADAETHHVLADARRGEGLVVEPAVRGRRRVDHERLGVADVGEVRAAARAPR